MGNKAQYTTRTEGAVKEALLTLLAEKPLADITVSELARLAHVSRSTFYEHYGNPADVYDAVVSDFTSGVSPLVSQITCPNELQPRGRTFCSLIRDAGEFAPAVRESRFLDTFLASGKGSEQHDLFELLTNAGYSQHEAEAVCAFQMSGCFAAARTIHVEDDEWAEIKTVIDRFILGGIAACLASRRGEPA